MEEEKNKLYVGNLPYRVDDNGLAELFSGIEGVEVKEAKVILEPSGRSKGFGFVTLATDEMADQAVKEVNGKDVDGRKIIVNVARPFVKRDDRGSDRRY